MNTQELQTFFDSYANAINEMDLASLKSHFSLPFIVVHKEPEGVISFDEELERKVKLFLMSLKTKGVSGLKATVSKSFDVSNYMTFVNIDWLLTDEDNAEIKSLSHSYIISNTQSRLSIVTLIVDDNSDLFLELFK